jgi:predicted molibdopterin-dependent oxidoreductase YjgC
MVELIVDERPVPAAEGQSLLQACLSQGIYIPHLCFMENQMPPQASCRLCFVQIEGYPAPVAACTVPVTAGLTVRTDTGPVRRLQRSALRLLLSVHAVDCRHCHANRDCALQQIARFLKIGLKSKPLDPILRDEKVDTSHPCIDHYPHRCVLCGKCITVCSQAGKSALTFAGRGINTRVSHFPANDDAAADCRHCTRCVSVCPVGALQMRAGAADSQSRPQPKERP